MPEISDFSSLTIALSNTPPSVANFSTPLLMVDHADITIDQRYKIVTRSSHSTDLTAGTDQAGWCAELWGQTYNPAVAYIGRWVKTASSPYIVFATPVSTIATWAAVTDGSLTITDGTNSDSITTLSFAAVTTMDNVATVIQTALQAIASPNITGLDTATVEVDDQDRIIIKNSTTGAAAAAIVTTPNVTGTDIATAALLGGVGFGQDGLDAETLEQSTLALLALTNAPFILCERGATTSEQVDFVTAMNALDKQVELVVTDSNAPVSGATTDAGYLINALGYQKAHVTYTANSDQYPDAALCGEVYAALEATVSVALTPIVGSNISGKNPAGTAIELTAAQVIALKAKGYDYLTKPSTVIHYATGLESGGNEVRIMIGKMFCEAKISEDVYGYMIAQNVVTYSDEDIAAIKGIIEYWLKEMENRKVLDPGWTVEMPLAEDFTAATKATHVMDLSNVAEAETQRSVNKINITLSWAV